jgi:hypothetical protein
VSDKPGILSQFKRTPDPCPARCAHGVIYFRDTEGALVDKKPCTVCRPVTEDDE